MTLNEAEYLYTYYTYVINIYTQKSKRTEQTNNKQQTNRKTGRKEPNEKKEDSNRMGKGFVCVCIINIYKSIYIHINNINVCVRCVVQTKEEE